MAIEATTGWRWVWPELVAGGFEVRPVEPGQARASARRRRRSAKTDRLDARWLARLPAKEMLPESWIPPAEIQGLRDRTRLRKALAEDRRGWGQRLHAYPARPRNWGKTTTAGTTTSTGHTARFASYHPAGATQRRVPRLQAFVVAISSAGSSTNTTAPEFANLRANRQLERKSVARDERRHEGAGPGLERLSYALREDRVQRGAEQPRARLGVRCPHV
jgi:hypothetical protein